MRTALKALTLVVILGLAACTSHGSPGTSSPTPSQSSRTNQSVAPTEIGAATTSPTSSPTPNPNPGLVVTDARLGRSGQAIVGLNGTVWLTTDAGTTWRAINPPMNPTSGHSVVDSQGSTIVALTIEGATLETTKLVYQWSKDAGKTWSRLNLTPPQSMASGEIALSADGSSVAVVASRYDSKTRQSTSVIFVGPVGKDLVGQPAPLAVVPAWVGTHLVLAGRGSEKNQLFVSDDRGKTWTQTTAAALAAASTGYLGSSPPGIGTPVRVTGGAVVPVTTFIGQVPSLSLLTTTDGRTFKSIFSVLIGQAGGGGEGALGSNAGPGGAVFVDFGSPRLFSVSGSTVTKVETTGLPLQSTPAAITFSDATHGLALVNLSDCVTRSDGTSECGSSHNLYGTSDGGHTWVAATRPSA